MQANQEKFERCLSDLDGNLKRAKKECLDLIKYESESLDDRVLKAEEESRKLHVEALEEYYQALKNPPVGMDGTADFLFVEGTTAEKFKKQFKALKFARGAKGTEESEMLVKKDYSEQIHYCQSIEKDAGHFKEVDRYAESCEHEMEMIRRDGVTLNKKDSTIRLLLNLAGGYGAGMGLVAMILGSRFVLSEVIGFGFVLAILGCVLLYFGVTMLSRRKQRRRRNIKTQSKFWGVKWRRRRRRSKRTRELQKACKR